MIFSDIMKELAKTIFLKIEEIYIKTHIKKVIAAGAGSKNSNFFHHLYDFAKEKNIHINIYSTPEPEVPILKGAVLFGFNNSIVRKRKSKYTICIQVFRNWNEDKYKDKGIKVPSDFEGDQNQYIDFLLSIFQINYCIDL